MLSPLPSSSCTPPEVPSSAERCPPPECPPAPIRSASRLYLAALARSHRTAALQSSICAGKGASPEKRNSLLATSYPSLKKLITGICCSSRPWLQPGALIQSITGDGPEAFLGQ